LNNNRNNRRRGRGNRSQGGGNQINRIDSRARGNAPQMLEKYKKLAQDAQHNGDRVQAEYYLQFADHYFRVIADNKTRQDEGRSRRPDDRDPTNDDDDENFEARDDYDRRRTSPRPRDRDRDREPPRFEGEPGEEGEATGVEAQQSPVEEAPRQGRSKDRGARRPARDNRPARKERGEAGNDAGIDAAILPPSIGAGSDAVAPDEEKRPRRRLKISTSGDDDLQAVG